MWCENTPVKKIQFESVDFEDEEDSGAVNNIDKAFVVTSNYQ